MKNCASHKRDIHTQINYYSLEKNCNMSFQIPILNDLLFFSECTNKLKLNWINFSISSKFATLLLLFTIFSLRLANTTITVVAAKTHSTFTYEIFVTLEKAVYPRKHAAIWTYEWKNIHQNYLTHCISQFPSTIFFCRFSRTPFNR